MVSSPVFYDQVSTCAGSFVDGGGGMNPIFLGPDPVFCAPRIVIPRVAENLRTCARFQGHFYEDAGMQYHAGFRGTQVRMWKWRLNSPEDSSDSWYIHLDNFTCIFVDAPLNVEGMVTGRVTVGASGNIRLVDNIVYSDASLPYGVPAKPDDPRSGSLLGIVSEGDVKVANTIPNGRENSSGRGGQGSDPSIQDITITGAIVALNESFTFEQQNDPDSGYVCPCAPDRRGTIYLYGSVAQMRRGWVNRNNRNFTGYIKMYRYDRRLHFCRPPGFFDVVDSGGRALFNIIQWGRAADSRADVQRSQLVRYN
jgi:hypothetical protein